jgi:hypothetical protein
MTYSGASVAMPTLALATPSLAATPSAQGYNSGVNGLRRIQANGDGSYNGETKEEGGNIYYWDEKKEEWILWVNDTNTPIGTTKTVEGKTYEWDGQYWVLMEGTDPGLPIGATPWLFMAVLAVGYVVIKSGKLKVKSGKLTTDHLI